MKQEPRVNGKNVDATAHSAIQFEPLKKVYILTDTNPLKKPNHGNINIVSETYIPLSNGLTVSTIEQSSIE